MSNGTVTVDLSNYKDRVGQRVAPGRYTVVVDDVEQDTARSGNTMINLWLRIVDGEYANSVVLDRLVLTEKSLFRVVGFMNAIGMQTPKKRLSVNVRLFLGRTLEVDVEDGEPYNGRVKSEVRGYIRPAKSSAPAEDLDEEITAEETPADEVLSGIVEETTDSAGEVDLDSVVL